jgi:acetyl esterase/lipase
MMQWFWDNYTTNPAERAQIHASPLNASAEQLKGLPPRWCRPPNSTSA